jgi:aspartyl-tRNA(Asn)/glutamyl-tRNA(Gln) amidotransferase subunit C
MSTLSNSDVAHLARLARLALTEEEQQRFAGQLSSVVGYIEQLSKVDTGPNLGIPDTTGLRTVVAEDEPRVAGSPADIDHQRLLAGSPRPQGAFFTVRAVLDGDGGAA